MASDSEKPGDSETPSPEAKGPAPEASNAEPVFGGVRGLLYIAVQAAVSEGFPLEQVLEHERLSEEAWLAADEAWSAALSESMERDPALFDNYDATYNAYKWAFHRVIEPLQSDVHAWVTFSTHLNRSEDPEAWLEEQRLDQNDVIRLQQLWAARMQEDEQVREQLMAELGAEPGPLPELEVPPKPLPPPVNTTPIDVPHEETSPEDAEPEPVAAKPALLVPLPVFAKPQVPKPEAEAPRASVPAPPPNELGFYVPPPAARVHPRPEPVPPAEVPRAAPAPPSMIETRSPPVAPPAWVSNEPSAPAPAGSVDAPRLGMHDYTSALAEIQAFPGDEERVTAKYGMTRETFQRERIAWDNQLARSPELRPQYAERLSRAVAHWQTFARTRR